MLGEEEEDRDLNKGSGSDSGSTPRKTYWRSASWSDRSPSKPSSSNSNIRPHFNSKVRSCLPPLQPLSISRRSVEEWPTAGSDDLGEWPHPPTPGARPAAGSVKPPLENNSEGPVRQFMLKKDKLAFFDKECSRIADHIYLGSEAVAKNREILRKNGITHVLNCVGFLCPEYFKSDLVYKTLWLRDSPTEDITSILYDVFDYFEDVQEQNGRVLVHCCQGISRSTSLVIAYLMWRDGQSFENAFQYVKAARGVTNPNMGFACQLLQCQKRVHAVPVSPASVLRMFRMAPHSQYDPLHLVPKTVHHPSPLGLDSRGAFIVHVPSTIYVWIGINCKQMMANNARASASQVVRYERAQGSIMIVEEGKEPLDFWDSFANSTFFADDFDKLEKEKKEAGGSVGSSAGIDHQVSAAINLGVGEKKVVEYDLDFETFQQALCGGVVPPFPLSGTNSETCLPAREGGWGRLRQKFAKGFMKELVTTSQLTCDNAQLDEDRDTCKEDDPSSPFTNPSLSPITPCDSPSSFSCYSKSSPKFNSKSPSPSPTFSVSDHSSVFTFSPASSNWSDTSSLSSQLSPSASEIREPFAAKLTPRREKLSVGGSSPSLAERRGNNPPSLMLFTSVNNPPPRAPRSMMRSWSFAPYTSNENMYEHFHESSRKEPPSDTDLKDVESDTKIGITDENLGKCRLTSNGLISEVLDIVHPVLFHWPTIERVDMLHSGVLDSRSVFLLLAPNVNVEENNSKILYVWVGRDAPFEEGQSQSQFIVSDEDRHFYWEKVGNNFLNQMGLPMDIPVQMIREGEDTEEFQDRLHHCSFYQPEESSAIDGQAEESSQGVSWGS